MTLEPWLALCRRYAKHRYCYEELVDDCMDLFLSLYSAGEHVQDAVDYVGGKYDLTTTDQWDGWGGTRTCPLSEGELQATRTS